MRKGKIEGKYDKERKGHVFLRNKGKRVERIKRSAKMVKAKRPMAGSTI